MRPYTFTAKIHHSLSAKSSVPVSDDVPRYSTPRTGLHTGRETRLRPNLRRSRQTQHSPALSLLSPPSATLRSTKGAPRPLASMLQCQTQRGNLHGGSSRPQRSRRYGFISRRRYTGRNKAATFGMKIYAPRSPRWGTPELKRVTRFPSSFFTYVDDFSLIAPRGTNDVLRDEGNPQKEGSIR